MELINQRKNPKRWKPKKLLRLLRLHLRKSQRLLAKMQLNQKLRRKMKRKQMQPRKSQVPIRKKVTKNPIKRRINQNLIRKKLSQKLKRKKMTKKLLKKKVIKNLLVMKLKKKKKQNPLSKALLLITINLVKNQLLACSKTLNQMYLRKNQ